MIANQRYTLNDWNKPDKIIDNEKNKELGCYRLIRNLDPNYITYLRDCGEQHNEFHFNIIHSQISWNI